MTVDNRNDRIELFGLPVDKISLDGTVEKIDLFIKSGQPHQIVLVNAAKVVNTILILNRKRDKFFHQVCAIYAPRQRST